MKIEDKNFIYLSYDNVVYSNICIVDVNIGDRGYCLYENDIIF